MLICRGLKPCRPDVRGCAVAIGNFDGLHLGHQAILATLKQSSRDADVPAAVLTFEPHPREYFVPAQAPARLMRMRDKAEALGASGISEMRVLRFDAALAGMEADTFVDEVLVRAMGAKRVVIGEGFRFGRERSGDVASLHRAGAAHGFVVDEVRPHRDAAGVVSSTRVRAALSTGRLDEAKSLLGREYRISGRVIPGQQLGRQLGFATANVRLNRRVSPVAGIFAVRVSGAGLDRRAAVASVGTRPTVGGTEWLLEVHIFDFEGDLYRSRLDVDFIARLRGELKFGSLEALAAEMRRDAELARVLLNG